MTYVPPMTIEGVKAESTPHHEWYHPRTPDCAARAPIWEDEWGDCCGGERCCRETGHDGDHMASDGANGWHYWPKEEGR